ncbi:MAG: helix-turn-helix transcriptional regulator, partial [Rubrivivax sp.]
GSDVLDGGAATMLLLGRRELAEGTAVTGFARSHGLTPAETRVLQALCAGVPPARIADEQGVRISTVRTQIGNLRDKTGARSIRALVRMVSVLPPTLPAPTPAHGGHGSYGGLDTLLRGLRAR